MADSPSLKQHIKPLEHLNFINACITTLNDFKLKKFQDGMTQQIINLSILLKKSDSEMEEFINLAGKHFTGGWWAKIAGGKVDFIEDNESNRNLALKMYEKIANFTYKDVVNYCLTEWISINKKNKIFPHKLTNVKDFFEIKEMDEIALNALF